MMSGLRLVEMARPPTCDLAARRICSGIQAAKRLTRRTDDRRWQVAYDEAVVILLRATRISDELYPVSSSSYECSDPARSGHPETPERPVS